MRVSGRCIGLAAMLAVLLPAPVAAQFYQCVAYAREATGMSIRGNANTWWGQAEGLYERGTAPRPGAIMAFHASRSMPMGHVAVVAEIVSPREVLLDHANWSRRGQVERGVRAVDVSAAGDWSDVRVWYARQQDLGIRSNPVAGFIYPEGATSPMAAPLRIAQAAPRGPLIGPDVIELAKLGG